MVHLLMFRLSGHHYAVSPFLFGAIKRGVRHL